MGGLIDGCFYDNDEEEIFLMDGCLSFISEPDLTGGKPDPYLLGFIDLFDSCLITGFIDLFDSCLITGFLNESFLFGLILDSFLIGF